MNVNWHILNKPRRALLGELVRTDFKLRYQGSVLGYAWSLLRPFLLFLILYVVFAKFLKLGNQIPHYPVYLLLGIVIWNFFNEMTMQSVGSIVARGDLIRKIHIPRWMIIISTSLSALINLGLNLIVVAILMAISRTPPEVSTLWFPMIIIEVYILSIGLSFFLSAVFVKYRDIGYIWEVSMQALFYITPIIYPLTRINNVLLQKFLLMNPMAQAIQDARFSVVTHQTITTYLLFQNKLYTIIPFLVVIFIGIAGPLYFNKQSKYFAENI